MDKDKKFKNVLEEVCVVLSDLQCYGCSWGSWK